MATRIYTRYPNSSKRTSPRPHMICEPHPSHTNSPGGFSSLVGSSINVFTLAIPHEFDPTLDPPSTPSARSASRVGGAWVSLARVGWVSARSVKRCTLAKSQKAAGARETGGDELTMPYSSMRLVPSQRRFSNKRFLRNLRTPLQLRRISI